VFLHYCERTRLDPFTRQIYLIERRQWNPNLGERGGYEYRQTIQTGIDGFRVIRDRAAAARREVVEYEDTIWYDGAGGEHKVWLEADAPAACKVVVLVWGDQASRPRRFPAVLRTASYMATNRDGKPQANWSSQPDHMIEKCCEAFALRRAFPQDLGGLYIEEEMQGPTQGENGQGKPPRMTAAPDDQGVWTPEPDPADDQSPDAVHLRALGSVHKLFGEHGLGGDEHSQMRHDILAAVLSDADALHPQIANSADLGAGELEQAATTLRRLITEEAGAATPGAGGGGGGGRPPPTGRRRPPAPPAPDRDPRPGLVRMGMAYRDAAEKGGRARPRQQGRRSRQDKIAGQEATS